MAPPSDTAASRTRRTSTPAVAAADGLSPHARTRRPRRVCASVHAAPPDERRRDEGGGIERACAGAAPRRSPRRPRRETRGSSGEFELEVVERAEDERVPPAAARLMARPLTMASTPPTTTRSACVAPSTAPTRAPATTPRPALPVARSAGDAREPAGEQDPLERDVHDAAPLAPDAAEPRAHVRHGHAERLRDHRGARGATRDHDPPRGSGDTFDAERAGRPSMPPRPCAPGRRLERPPAPRRRSRPPRARS